MTVTTMLSQMTAEEFEMWKVFHTMRDEVRAFQTGSAPLSAELAFRNVFLPQRQKAKT